MKYPRTYHLPFSPGCQRNDKIITSVERLLNIDVIITEKLDGSNVCLQNNNIFARSHEGTPTHPCFGELKLIHSTIKHLIPEGVQIFGEWCLAIKSLEYTEMLPSFLSLIAIRESKKWKSWQETEQWAKKLNLPTVPIIKSTRFQNKNDMKTQVEAEIHTPSKYGTEKEGVVVRVKDEFLNEDFEYCVAKWVKKDFVQNDTQWKKGVFKKHKVSR